MRSNSVLYTTIQVVSSYSPSLSLTGTASPLFPLSSFRSSSRLVFLVQSIFLALTQTHPGILRPGYRDMNEITETVNGSLRLEYPPEEYIQSSCTPLHTLYVLCVCVMYRYIYYIIHVMCYMLCYISTFIKSYSILHVLRCFHSHRLQFPFIYFEYVFLCTYSVLYICLCLCIDIYIYVYMYTVKLSTNKKNVLLFFKFTDLTF